MIEVEDDEPSADLSLDDDTELNGDARSVQERVQNRTFVVSWRALLTDPHWVKVSDIFNPNIRDWDLLKKLVSSPEDPLFDRYSERLQNVRKIGDYQYVMHVIERGLTYEEVAEIVRVNSLGMKLRGSDLAMAQITARWQGLSISSRNLPRCARRCGSDSIPVSSCVHSSCSRPDRAGSEPCQASACPP